MNQPRPSSPSRPLREVYPELEQHLKRALVEDRWGSVDVLCCARVRENDETGKIYIELTDANISQSGTKYKALLAYLHDALQKICGFPASFGALVATRVTEGLQVMHPPKRLCDPTEGPEAEQGRSKVARFHPPSEDFHAAAAAAACVLEPPRCDTHATRLEALGACVQAHKAGLDSLLRELEACRAHALLAEARHAEALQEAKRSAEQVRLQLIGKLQARDARNAELNVQLHALTRDLASVRGEAARLKEQLAGAASDASVRDADLQRSKDDAQRLADDAQRLWGEAQRSRDEAKRFRDEAQHANDAMQRAQKEAAATLGAVLSDMEGDRVGAQPLRMQQVQAVARVLSAAPGASRAEMCGDMGASPKLFVARLHTDHMSWASDAFRAAATRAMLRWNDARDLPAA